MQVTKDDRGAWYDPQQDGAGFEIRVLDDGLFFGEFFCGRVEGWFDKAVWFSIQGKPDDLGRLPLYLTTGAVLGDVHDLGVKQVGTVVFNKIDSDTIIALVDIYGNGEDQFSPEPLPVSAGFTLKRLVR